jgi:hypothetical protein
LASDPEMLRLYVNEAIMTLDVLLDRDPTTITDWIIKKPITAIPDYLEAFSKLQVLIRDLTGTLGDLAYGGAK